MEVISGGTEIDAGIAISWTELIPDPTLLCDEQGIILSANRKALAFFGGHGIPAIGRPGTVDHPC